MKVRVRAVTQYLIDPEYAATELHANKETDHE